NGQPAACVLARDRGLAAQPFGGAPSAADLLDRVRRRGGGFRRGGGGSLRLHRIGQSIALARPMPSRFAAARHLSRERDFLGPSLIGFMQYARGLLAGLGEGIVRSATVRVFRRSALQARRGAEGNAAAYI